MPEGCEKKPSDFLSCLDFTIQVDGNDAKLPTLRAEVFLAPTTHLPPTKDRPIAIAAPSVEHGFHRKRTPTRAGPMGCRHRAQCRAAKARYTACLLLPPRACAA